MRQLLYYTIYYLLGITCPFNIFGQAIDSTQIADYQSIATQAWEAEDYPKAAKFQKKLLDVYQQQNEIDSAFQQTYRLVRTYYYRNQLDSTKYYLDLPTRKNWLSQISPQHDNLNNYWNLWGVYAYVMGDYSTAGRYFEKILATELTAVPLDHEAIVGSFNNLGVIYDEVGDYTKSMYYLEQGLQFRKDSLQDYLHLNTVELLNTLAYEYYVFKDYAKADSLYNDAFVILKQLPTSKRHSSLFTKLCRNISLSKVKQNEPNNAIEWLSQALENIARNDGSTVSSAMTYDLLGYALLNKKQYKLAIENLNKSLDLFKQIRPAKHPRIAALYRDLGEVYNQQGETKTALKYYQKALTSLVYDFNDSTNVHKNPQLDQSINSRIELLKVLKGKAEVLRLIEGSQVAALQTYQLASSLLDSLRINYVAAGSKYVLLEQATAIYEGAIQTALSLDSLELAWEWAERSKAVLLLENLKKIQAAEFANLPDSLLQRERDYKVEIAYEERQLFSAQRKGNQAMVDSLRQKLFYQRRNYQQFLEQLERDNPRYYQLKYDTKVASLQEVQNELLKDNDILLEYFMGEKELYCFIVSQNKFDVARIPHSSRIQEDILSLNQIINTPNTEYSNYLEFNKLASKLYSQLVSFTDSLLTSNQSNHLIIIPSAELSYLPFGVLIEHPLSKRPSEEARYDTLSYLIKKHPISYGFSSTLLLENRRTQAASKKVSFAAFAPVFDGAISPNRSARNLGKLTNSIREVETINTLWNGDIYLKETANKTAFLNQLHQYNILHFATHATLNDNEPNDSRIYFYDDYLTTTEIYNLPLQADLIVLSACETGTGTLQRGEGLISLARAFAYANCPSLVTSLWQVDDQATADLMIDLHQHLAEAKPKDVALQQTQINYLDNPLQAAEMKHPYYWAAFVQVGGTEAIVQTGWNWWWLVVGLFGVFVAFFALKNRKVVGSKSKIQN